MALVKALGNGFTRITLSLLVLFATDFMYKCFTVEFSTIIVLGLFLCRVLGSICSVISSLADFLSSWSKVSLSSLLLNYWHGSSHMCYYLTDWYWASCGFSFFFTSYYGAMIITSCGYLYIIFSLMLSLEANFGVIGYYTIWMFWYLIWIIVQ